MSIILVLRLIEYAVFKSTNSTYYWYSHQGSGVLVISHGRWPTLMELVCPAPFQPPVWTLLFLTISALPDIDQFL